MARLKIEEEDAEKKCALTEKTMSLLNRAKDNLANSYVVKLNVVLNTIPILLWKKDLVM